MRQREYWQHRWPRVVVGAAGIGLVSVGWHAYLAPENVLAVLANFMMCG